MPIEKWNYKNLIERFIERGSYIDLWRYITAMRGPDVEGLDELKYWTTIPLRGFESHAVGYNCDDLCNHITEIEPETFCRQYKQAGKHFAQHLFNAFTAVGSLLDYGWTEIADILGSLNVIIFNHDTISLSELDLATQYISKIKELVGYEPPLD